MANEYTVNGSDLSAVFASRTSAKRADVGYAINGTDVSNYWEKSGGGDQINYNTGFAISDGTDFRYLFRSSGYTPPTATPSPTPNPTPTPTPTPTAGPSPGPTATPGFTPNPTPGPTPNPTPNPTPGPTPNPTPTPTPSATPTCYSWNFYYSDDAGFIGTLTSIPLCNGGTLDITGGSSTPGDYYGSYCIQDGINPNDYMSSGYAQNTFSTCT